jgi:hypothetical protein
MAQVCIKCRNPQAKTDGDSHCLKCGSETTYRSLQYWSPPKKNNLRAWKRIANGEWLWDRRRVQRVGARWPYANIWRAERRPTHKKGQETSLQRSWPQSGRELGG